MAVGALRNELKARNISSKGLKSQLVARLTKALKAETEKSDDGNKEKEESESENVPEEKKSEVEEKKLNEREKALLEKRYTLPEQQHILVHPSKTAKSGKFDCTTMSLSLLLDYRPEDTKEHSFEVSLFAELFNEMLMRDFGFNIFRALHELPEKAKDDKKKKEEEKKKDDDKKKEDDKKKNSEKKKEDRKDESEKLVEEEKKLEESEDKKEDDKKDSKKEEKKSDESDDDEEVDEEGEKDKKKDKEKKKKERVKLYTKDKHLLLSFVYFDQTHCGYIFDKDIEDLLYTLGLNLSRAQVRKLVSKVVTRDSLHYRKLTDRPREEDLILIDDAEKESNLHELALGNKRLLPICIGEDGTTKKRKLNCDGSKESGGLEEGLVMFRGSLVDVSKLMSQLERSERARLDTEARMVELKTENQKLSEKCGKSNSSLKHLNSEVKDYKEKVRNMEESLSRITAYSKLYQSTLADIRDKIDPVLKSTSHKEEPSSFKKEKEEKDKKHDENKSRWEKEIKKEAEDESVEVKREIV